MQVIRIMKSSKSLLILGSCLLGLALAQDEQNSGYKLIQAKPENERDRELLKEMDEFYPEDVVDFWSDPKEDTVEFLVQGVLVKDVCEFLEKENVTYRIKVDNIQKSVDEEMRHIEDDEGEFTFRFGGGPTDSRSEFNLFNYHPLEKIYDFVTQMEAGFPDMVKVTNVKKTYEGRQIKLVHVSLDLAETSKQPAIFIDCGIHAREWVSPAFCLYTIDRLVDEGWWGLLYYFDVYMIPVANPDGYAYTWTTTNSTINTPWGRKAIHRFWRKNRRPTSTKNEEFATNSTKFDLPRFQSCNFQICEEFWCAGVDLNRNFDISFGSTSSNDPCSNVYHRTGPFSEPETQAIKVGLEDAIKEHNGKVIQLSIHSYTQKWMFPNSYNRSQSIHHNDLKFVAQKAVEALRNEHGTVFQSGPTATTIYPASGTSGDWAHEKLGIKYSFALELRDKGSSGFLLPVNEIQPTVEETYAGVVAMANEIYKEFQFGTSTQQTTTKEQTTSNPTTIKTKEPETTTEEIETTKSQTTTEPKTTGLKEPETSEVETTTTKIETIETTTEPTTIKAKEPETAPSGVETTIAKIETAETQTTKNQKP